MLKHPISTHNHHFSCLFFCIYNKKALTLHKIGCTRPSESKLSWRSFALSVPI